MSVRYGAKIRKKEAAVLKQQTTKYECPSCFKKNVERVGNSIWHCKSCNAKFAGGAYSLETAVGSFAKKFLAGKVQA